MLSQVFMFGMGNLVNIFQPQEIDKNTLEELLGLSVVEASKRLIKIAETLSQKSFQEAFNIYHSWLGAYFDSFQQPRRIEAFEIYRRAVKYYIAEFMPWKTLEVLLKTTVK